ncbi:hypothetical protein [Clostridium sp.]|uniref:hypothetical protein n=1 Tax=Clostridium sp. TaxID=1506 RepID=UPI0039927D57
MRIKDFDLRTYLENIIESDHKTIVLEDEAISELGYISSLLQEKTGFFLILLEGKPLMYTPPTEFAIWLDDFDKTYQIDVPNELSKEEIIALYQELEELQEIHDIRLM